MASDTIQLTAYRPEADRYARLARVLKRVEVAVWERGMAAQWVDALVSLDDRKGDLTPVWRSAEDEQTFGAILNDAWRAEDQVVDASSPQKPSHANAQIAASAKKPAGSSRFAWFLFGIVVGVVVILGYQAFA